MKRKPYVAPAAQTVTDLSTLPIRVSLFVCQGGCGQQRLTFEGQPPFGWQQVARRGSLARDWLCGRCRRRF